MTMKYILLPTDGSVTAQAAARFAEDIARAEDSTIIVLGVVVPTIFLDVDNQAITAATKDYLATEVAAEAARIRSHGIPAEEVVIESTSPHRGILDTADERGVVLIAMGTHGRGGLTRAILGSVADRVVRHSKVPVLLMPLKEED